MSDIVTKLRQSYHLDTVQPEHPIRRAVDEIERLRVERDGAVQDRLRANEERRAAQSERDEAVREKVQATQTTQRLAAERDEARALLREAQLALRLWARANNTDPDALLHARIDALMERAKR